MSIKENRKGFTLVELLAVIVVLAVVILIAVTAVIPRMNNAKKKALVDEALVYLKAAKEAYSFDPQLLNASSCTNVTDLNGKYVKKDSDNYKGAIKTTYSDGVVSQTIYLTDGKFYVSGSDNITSDNVSDEKPAGFLNSCGDYNPVLADNVDTDSLAYRLIMNEGGVTFDENLSIIDEKTRNLVITTTSYDSSNSGIYKAEDDNGGTYYYRGNINNNWLEFGGFYWRILRINGDGSIRILYSGLKSSTHKGDDVLILNSINERTTKFSAETTSSKYINDISGLSSQKFETKFSPFQYTGYMYDTNRNLQLAEVSNETIATSWNIVTFNADNDIYLFKNFSTSNCNTSGDNIACTLICRNLGDDCIKSTWRSIVTERANFSENAADGGASYKPAYISDYKYTCVMDNVPSIVNNSDGTTSVYISCPRVEEILGNSGYSPSMFISRTYSYIIKPSVDNINNVKDSNLKKEIDIWYESNIFNVKDESGENYLENYISDEIFCNDRSVFEQYNGQYYSASRRIMNSNMPSLKCKNRRNDGFTLSETTPSLVEPNNLGNNHLKYPVATVTGDELTYACLRMYGGVNGCYFNDDSPFWTMSPSGLTSAGGFIIIHGKSSSKSQITSMENLKLNGIRPVINLRPDILYDSGSGTEVDPYKVKLSTS